MSSLLNAPKIPFKKPLQHPSKFVLNSSVAFTDNKQFELLDIEDKQSSSYSTTNSDNSLNDTFANEEVKGVTIIDALVHLNEQCKYKFKLLLSSSK